MTKVIENDSEIEGSCDTYGIMIMMVEVMTIVE